MSIRRFLKELKVPEDMPTHEKIMFMNERVEAYWKKHPVELALRKFFLGRKKP